MLFFYLFALLAVAATVVTIVAKNPVTSAVSLVVSFAGLAGIYVLLNAPFVAALQVLVYAGAIMVLFLFVIMLLNLKDDELEADGIGARAIPAALAGLALFAFLAWQIFRIPGEAVFVGPPPGFGSVRDVAKVMLTDYAVPFEVLGILLLVGLVGAMCLGRRGE